MAVKSDSFKYIFLVVATHHTDRFRPQRLPKYFNIIENQTHSCANDNKSIDENEAALKMLSFLLL